MSTPPTGIAAGDNPYEVLEVSQAATDAEIKKAYFAGVRKFPPEREPEAFKRIRTAYEKLNTPEKRLDFDMSAPSSLPDPPPSPAIDYDFRITDEVLIQAVRVMTELSRRDWREDHREVTL